ncbi:MAG: flagellar hook-associated protein FlgK [Lachnospiraceae bacterium]|nr:flagellar hook-associated protein FlgK [Lachnospiraceae bacterium]
MPSQFFGLNIAYTGLLASNAALNTTANNISNEQTEGYSRQVVNQTASDALRTYTTYGCAGSGVDVNSIDRVRDVFYDFKYWNNNAQVGEYSILKEYMWQIQDYFKDDEFTEGFTTIFNKMVENLAELKKDAGSVTTKQQFVGSAESLTYYFNTMAENLEKLQLEINLQIENKVDMINSYATAISALNKQINVIELGGITANELRDQRDSIIDKLSKIVDVQTEEIPVRDSNYPDRETGANRYIVKIAGGQKIVDTNEYYELVCEARPNYETINQSDAVGLYDIYFKDGREFNIYSNVIGGELRGLIQLRDGNNGESFKGTIENLYWGTLPNGDQRNMVDVSVTADYLKDLNPSILSPTGGVVTLGNEEYCYDSFSVTYNAAGEIEKYTFVISNDTNKNYKQPDPSRIGKEAAVGKALNYQGIPYYQEQLNEWVRIFAKAFNDIATVSGAEDGEGNPADIFFAADKPGDTIQYHFDASQNITAGTVIYSTDDSYYLLTAKNFAVSSRIVENADLFATHTLAGAGESKYDIVENLINMQEDKKVASFRGAAAGEFLQCVLADVALNASNAITFYDTYTGIQNTIETQRTSISGVDGDEEAINLVKFQHSYNLASQMIQVLTEIYDRLILQTGV